MRHEVSRLNPLLGTVRADARLLCATTAGKIQRLVASKALQDYAEVVDHLRQVLRADKLVALDDALVRLEQQDPAKAQLVKLRYFAELSHQEAADALGISTTTADRFWAYARAWLQQEMAAGNG